MPGFSRPWSSQPQSEKNFFIVTGLPEQYNWQMLKDLIRNVTTNQPGWTNIDESRNGPEGAKGYFSVKSQQDAESVYNLLVRVMYARLGRPLLVHHFDASGPEPLLVKCNCRSYYPGAGGHSDSRSCITARSMLAAQNSPDWQPISQPQYVSNFSIPMQHPGMTVPITMPQLPVYTPPVSCFPVPRAMAAPIIPMPAMINEHGLPINVTNGVVRTESRMLHISGISWNASEAELRELLRPYGRLLGVELKRTYATVRLGTTEEARRAIESLDKTLWKGRQIAVKKDRDSTAISEPVIVRSAPQQVGTHTPQIA
ncbi:hypothetical protein DBV05_g11841 [Lasiodiplodia theobromae]|uniref:RRM domain-containing protein n=1 Tax=Lasiodiplodia theobromae TaxID=45133 RepID=A0A5N5CVW2_9PEZI|nr:hypothetical protein DBV05_g11841 [Lasiodiplodia theobromae]